MELVEQMQLQRLCTLMHRAYVVFLLRYVQLILLSNCYIDTNHIFIFWLMIVSSATAVYQFDGHR